MSTFILSIPNADKLKTETSNPSRDTAGQKNLEI